MTLRELSARFQVPESTLRLYRDEFADLVPCTGQGRRRRYAEDGAEILGRIVAWKREGWGSGRIREALARERTPTERARRRTNEERLDEALLLLKTQAEEMAMLRVEVGALRASVRDLSEALRPETPLHLEDILAEDILAASREQR